MSRADDLLTAANPVSAPVSDEVVDEALRRVLARTAAEPLPTTARSPRRRRARRAAALATVAVVVAAVFLVANVVPTGREPGTVGTAWAKSVIRRANAALADAASGVLHVEMTVHEAFPDANGGHGVTDDFTVDSWDDLSATGPRWASVTTAAEPNDEVPVAADTIWTVVTNERLTSYDQNSNTITVGIARAFASADPATLSLAGSIGTKDALQSSTSPGGGLQLTFSELLRRLIDSNDVTVVGTVSRAGSPAIEISAANGVSVYVDPQTYQPLEIDVNRAPSYTETITFGAYETLPAGSVTAPDLQALHPDAKVVQQP
jgi:hypothetical protein